MYSIEYTVVEGNGGILEHLKKFPRPPYKINSAIYRNAPAE
eukprot:SAG11_NODE_210_length_12303_cov_10.235824_10_plen_41_part_00